MNWYEGIDHTKDPFYCVLILLIRRISFFSTQKTPLKLFVLPLSCSACSAKDVSNPVCPSEPQFSSTVSPTSSSLIFPHNHQSSFGLVACALFLSLLPPHAKAGRSGHTRYTRHAPLAFHRVALFRSDCAEERSWPLATSPRPSRGGGGCRQPTWLSRVGTVHREPGAEGAQKHAPARPPLGPAVSADPQLSRGWEGSLGAPLQNVACKLRVGSSSRRQRSEKVLHFSVSPNFQKRVSRQKWGKPYPYNSAICSSGAFLI